MKSDCPRKYLFKRNYEIHAHKNKWLRSSSCFVFLVIFYKIKSFRSVLLTDSASEFLIPRSWNRFSLIINIVLPYAKIVYQLFNCVYKTFVWFILKRNKIIKYVTCFIVYDNLMTLNVTVCEAISSFITEKSFNNFQFYSAWFPPHKLDKTEIFACFNYMLVIR